MPLSVPIQIRVFPSDTERFELRCSHQLIAALWLLAQRLKTYSDAIPLTASVG